MKKLAPLLLIQIAMVSFQASYHSIDSLKQVLAAEEEDTNKVGTLSYLASAYVNFKPDTALLLAQQGLFLSRQIDYPLGELVALNNIANIFVNTGNYPGALENYLSALKIAEQLNAVRFISSIDGNIGIIYLYQEDYTQYRDYSLKAMKINNAAHYDKGLTPNLINMGDCYEKLSLLDSARIYTAQGYELAVKLHDIEGRGIAENNFGNIYAKMNQPALAIEYYRLSIEDYTTENDEEGICQSTLGIATQFLKTGKADSALHYATISMDKASAAGFLPDKLDASVFLAGYYEAHNDIQRAFSLQKAMIADKDSLFNLKKIRGVQNLSYDESMRQRELAEERRKAAERARKDLQLWLITLFIPTFFLTVLLLRRKKIKHGIIEFMGILSLLFLFEFITLFIHPYLEGWTKDSPVIMLLILVAIATILVPLHHRLEHWVKMKLGHTGKTAPHVVTEEVEPKGS